ncbi:MAG: KH domain-containing protein [bacterium]
MEMNEMSTFIKDYINENIKKIVDHPDDVEINVSTSTKNVIIQIRVNDTDYGKVIGRKGNTIQSLKILTMAVKNTNYPEDKRKVSLELLEDETRNFSFK